MARLYALMPTTAKWRTNQRGTIVIIVIRTLKSDIIISNTELQ
jgi:hypothetical protein